MKNRLQKNIHENGCFLVPQFVECKLYQYNIWWRDCMFPQYVPCETIALKAVKTKKNSGGLQLYFS